MTSTFVFTTLLWKRNTTIKLLLPFAQCWKCKLPLQHWPPSHRPLSPPTDLEVYDDGEDEDGGQQVHEVGEVLAVEGFAQTSHLVLAGSQQVEQRDHRTFKLRP